MKGHLKITLTVPLDKKNLSLPVYTIYQFITQSQVKEKRS